MLQRLLWNRSNFADPGALLSDLLKFLFENAVQEAISTDSASPEEIRISLEFIEACPLRKIDSPRPEISSSYGAC